MGEQSESTHNDVSKDVNSSLPAEPSCPWGKSSSSLNNVKRKEVDLKSIMFEQEKEREEKVAQKQMDEIRLSEIAEEEEMIRLAMAMSMSEMNVASGLEETRIGQSQSPYAAAPMVTSTSVEKESIKFQATEVGISDADSEAIQRALQEANEEEERKSMQLALRMIQEESENSSKQPPVAAGNVRTMTRAQLEAEQVVGATRTSRSSTNFYPIDDYEEDSSAAGFRLNSTTSQQWARRDQNSIVGPNNEIRTKHDIALHGKANAHRLGLEAEKNGASPSVGNAAYNSFMQSVRRKKKGVASHGTGRAGSDAEGTKGGSMDPHVRIEISRAINGGLIKKCNGVVKEGKEAVVHHADCGENSEGFDVAVKVFKRIVEFRGRADYVDGDPRYMGQAFRKAGSREQQEIWAEKEFRNLIRAHRSGVPVPKPLSQKENVLFMRFIGEEGWPAPQLRELNLRKGSTRWTTLYRQIMDAVKRLYQSARLVHGDLSEYNILVAPNFLVDSETNAVDSDREDLQAVLIDFGQAVDTRHPDSRELLLRDVERIRAFFLRQEIETIPVADAMASILEPNESRETL